MNSKFETRTKIVLQGLLVDPETIDTIGAPPKADEKDSTRSKIESSRRIVSYMRVVDIFACSIIPCSPSQEARMGSWSKYTDLVFVFYISLTLLTLAISSTPSLDIRSIHHNGLEE